MSKCVLGHETVGKVQALARKVEESCLLTSIPSQSLPQHSTDVCSSILSSSLTSLDDSVITSASLLPTAACLLLGNPAIRLQPALVSVFHFFLVSPIYSFTAIDQYRPKQLSSKDSPSARSAAPSKQLPGDAPGEPGVAESRPLHEASDEHGSQPVSSQVASDFSSHTNNLGGKRQMVGSFQAFKSHEPISNHSGISSLQRRSAIQSRSSVGTFSRNGVAAPLQREECPKQTTERTPEDVEPFGGLRESRLSFSGPLGTVGVDRAGFSGAESHDDVNAAIAPEVAEFMGANLSPASDMHATEDYAGSANTYDTALFLQPSIAAIQQLHILAAWMAREFRARLIQEAEVASASHLASRHKRQAKKGKSGTTRVGRQGRRMGGTLHGSTKCTSEVPNRTDDVNRTNGHLQSCKGELPVSPHASDIHDLLLILSLIGLVELETPIRGVLKQPAAEIVTSAAFMHASVEAFTLELLTPPAAFIFESCFEATRHAQKVHFRLGSERHQILARLPRDPLLETRKSAADPSREGLRHTREKYSTEYGTADASIYPSSTYSKPEVDFHPTPRSGMPENDAPWYRFNAHKNSDQLTNGKLTASVSSKFLTWYDALEKVVLIQQFKRAFWKLFSQCEKCNRLLSGSIPGWTVFSGILQRPYIMSDPLIQPKGDPLEGISSLHYL